jgi:hypothetical protein
MKDRRILKPPLPDAPQRTSANNNEFSDIMPPESPRYEAIKTQGLGVEGPMPGAKAPKPYRPGKALPKAVKHIESKRLAQQEKKKALKKGPKIHALGGTPPDLKLRRLKGVGTPRSAQPLEGMTPETAPAWRTNQPYIDNPNWETKKSKGGKK